MRYNPKTGEFDTSEPNKPYRINNNTGKIYKYTVPQIAQTPPKSRNEQVPAEKPVDAIITLVIFIVILIGSLIISQVVN